MSEAWLERWQEGRIGWHQDEGNAGLRQHWRASGRRVLVPLCGKSVDLCWLAGQGNAVVGVELSRLAIEAFFAEQGQAYEVCNAELPMYRSLDADITIYCGDYFALTSVRCDGHYDRGALIAMPPDLRPDYARHTSALLEGDAEQLVITVEYDEAIATGPPFSVSNDEVKGYWPRLSCIDQFDDIDAAPPKFIDAGLTRMFEKVWRTP